MTGWFAELPNGIDNVEDCKIFGCVVNVRGIAPFVNDTGVCNTICWSCWDDCCGCGGCNANKFWVYDGKELHEISVCVLPETKLPLLFALSLLLLLLLLISLFIVFKLTSWMGCCNALLAIRLFLLLIASLVAFVHVL